MKKNLLLFFILVASQVIVAQYDKWPSVNTASLSGGEIYTKKSIKVDNDIFTIVDTSSNFGPSATGLYKYNTIDRSLQQYSYPIEWGDRGIQATTTYTTAGASYGVFGCYAINDNASYPVIYTYNSLTNLITADSIYIGSPYDHNDGIQTMSMFSPSSNDDTLRIFSRYFNSINVFKKHIDQIGVSPSYVSLPMDEAYASTVFNGKLYVCGYFSVNNVILESSDGNTFAPATFFNNINYVNNIRKY